MRRDGSVLRADVRFDAVRDARGALAEHQVTIRDASDRRRSDELRAQWEVLFRLTRRGIAVTDPRTRVLVAVNPAYAAMHGGEVEDFVGLPVCVRPDAGVGRAARRAAATRSTSTASSATSRSTSARTAACSPPRST